MTTFKKEILTRFVDTDEGEVTEYLGCEMIRDRSAKTAKIIQKGYAGACLENFWNVGLQALHYSVGC